ncbi:hypothetical protein [Streptacidiphilus monticola]|uniref:PPM-type phosphatase domain-containing protein n=1 Tax=Streptacidiphilus monticola TaxID=2161674 RepID=A0ABW1FXP1_9ACTN
MYAADGVRWSLWITDDAPAAAYPRQRRLRTGFPAGAGTGSLGFRALVELHRNHGGTAPRFVLGGMLATRRGRHLDLDVRESGDDWAGTPFEGPSGVRYQPGLPSEYSCAVQDGCAEELSAGQPVGGTLVIDRAGHMGESSPLLAREAAGLLVRALTVLQRGEDPLAAAVARLGERPGRAGIGSGAGHD